jgi:hypothetical protein
LCIFVFVYLCFCVFCHLHREDLLLSSLGPRPRLTLLDYVALEREERVEGGEGVLMRGRGS